MQDSGATQCKQGDISRELVRLNESKENLHNRIGILFDRVQELLSPSMPKTEVAKSLNAPVQSKFALDLSGISATIETDLDKINEILDRLEL